jgi:hypothetical protein
LPEAEGNLGIGEVVLVDDTGIGHFVVEVVALAGTFTHPCKYGESAVLFGDVVDELKDDDRLAHASTAKGTDLTSFEEGTDEVHHLDSSLQDLRLGGLVHEFGWVAVDGPAGSGRFRTLVDGFANHIKNPSEHLLAHGTEMAEPVAVTSCPRTRPSVVDMATARTCPSPRCC